MASHRENILCDAEMTAKNKAVSVEKNIASMSK